MLDNGPDMSDIMLLPGKHKKRSRPILNSSTVRNLAYWSWCEDFTVSPSFADTGCKIIDPQMSGATQAYYCAVELS